MVLSGNIQFVIKNEKKKGQKDSLYKAGIRTPDLEQNKFYFANSPSNLSSYFGLIDKRMRAFDKDLPVLIPPLQ
jgi:hypothetical protein